MYLVKQILQIDITTLNIHDGWIKPLEWVLNGLYNTFQPLLA